METILAIIVGSIILIIGALFGKWLNQDAIQKAVNLSFENATELMKYQAKFESGKDLQRSFTDIMYWLEHEATTAKVNIAPRLRRNPEVWEEVIKSFRVHLRDGERIRFDAICETFYKKDGNTRYNYPTLELDSNSANEALDNIKAVLKFAK